MSGGTGSGDRDTPEARPPGGREGGDGEGDATAAGGGAGEGSDGGTGRDDCAPGGASARPTAEEDGPAAEEDDPGGRHPADETVRTDALPDAIRCPHCGEEDSEQFSSFGSAVSVSQYYCRSCRTVFEAFKWR